MNDDRWLLPSRQSDLPGRDLIAPTTLHARREGTFLVLAALFLVATIALPLWFASSWVVDLSGLPFDIAGATELTVGVIVFPVALIVGQLVCEIYGTRRAGMLVLMGTLASLAIVIGEQLTVANYPLALALALVAATTVTNTINILVFASASRALDGRALWLRSFLATPVALLVGWSAFTAAWVGLGLDVNDAIVLASAPCLYACACALAATIPLVIARLALKTYLRVGGSEAPPVDHSLVAPPRRLPQALIVDDEPDVLYQAPATRALRPHHLPFTTSEGPRVTQPRSRPFTTGEIEFFREGDEMANLRDTLV
ncbi:MAG: VUT family protein [Kofleriaceae bacterium]